MSEQDLRKVTELLKEVELEEREKVPEFSPAHSQNWYFLIDKKSKSLTQQGF